MLELKSRKSDERSDVAGNKVSASAVTAPEIPAIIVASRPTPIAVSSRHLRMKVNPRLLFDNQAAVSDSVASRRSVLPRCKQRKKIRPADWSWPTCFNSTRAAPNKASFVRKAVASRME